MEIQTFRARGVLTQGEYVELGEDCAVNDVTIHPGATELCDGLINDCLAEEAGGTRSDGDEGPVRLLQPGGEDRSGFGDCDDSDDTAFPGRLLPRARRAYERLDGDGYGASDVIVNIVSERTVTTLYRTPSKCSRAL